jgi:hypothetical protein
LSYGQPDIVFEQRQTCEGLCRAILSLEPLDRIIIALRHGVMDACSVIDTVVIANASVSVFVEWLLQELKVPRHNEGPVRNVVGIRSGIISDKLIISYYAARSNC